ncbi:hypothetical protein L2E82_15191 [Cichorium intybus]|uniref:Uncharacterized protein n=1 Tax=Cichorium intybus TaxID=13427 RepID=A0ACB9F1R1_CICIN|nr:hypothetical protein L2E82_15191 [Cichorium intybus]
MLDLGEIRIQGEAWEPSFCNPDGSWQDSDDESEGISDTFRGFQGDDDEDWEDGEIGNPLGKTQNDSIGLEQLPNTPKPDFHPHIQVGGQVENENRERQPSNNGNEVQNISNYLNDEGVKVHEVEMDLGVRECDAEAGLGSQLGPLNEDPISLMAQVNSGGDNCVESMDQTSSNNADIEKSTSENGIRVGENAEAESPGQEEDNNTHPSQESSSLPLDLNTDPNEDVLRENSVNNQRKLKKSHWSQGSQFSPSKSENSISVEMLKTKNIGGEIGFCLDGFKEMLRAEIEGEGVGKQQK